MGFSRVLPLIIGALSLFSNIAERVDDVDDGSSGDLEIGTNDSDVTTFLNFSQKTNGDRRYWYENVDDRMPKSKGDIQSRLLKMNIEQLRNKTDQVELVFLVDASGSVGADNFRSELSFVTKLLSDFTVDTMAARIALITFGGRGNVYRNVDQISRHGPNDHKCYLLNKQFRNITYSGGGTYTRGALLEALAILEKSREAASKVVFLITDGFSNGGDPRPAAHLLKNTGAIVFAFGIRTGNVEELHDIASPPWYAHSYFLDSFAEFEALARRALHRDLRTGQYVAVTRPNDCNSLCSDSELAASANRTCCDELATCTCGTATGHYACICPSGYFGSGLRGFCQPCPNGTYASGNTSGDSTAACVACPDANHVTVKVPSTSVADCICAFGFTTDGYKCEAITCPKLRIPENGYLVKASACSNVVHAACGVRCRIGFHLTGDSIRLCGKDGAWSGNEPQCLLKTCPALRAPAHGRVKCEHDEDYQHQFEENSTVYPIDTRCQFRCDVGYQLRGSKVRNCLPLSRWDGLKVTCKAVKCEPLPQIANGDIIPEICTGPAKVPFATNCTFTCNEGFVLEGPTDKSCTGRTGIWSQRHSINQCVDKTPPSMECPAEIVEETTKGQNYAYVNWTVPEVTDNADASPSLWTKPYVVLPWKAKIGTRVIVYVARDASGNKSRCKFKVKVLDREPPTIENCVDPPTFYSDFENGLANVTWDEPVFYDNSRISVRVNQSHQPGKNLFPIGLTKVFYHAADKYGNQAICVLNITVEDACKNLKAPMNGQLNCSLSDDQETRCVVTCKDDYDFAIEPANFDIVNDELLLKCNSSNHTWESNHLPECSETQTSKAISQEGNVILESNESAICDNQTALRQLSEHVANDLKWKLLEICDNDIECNLITSDPKCEDDELSSSKNFLEEDNLIRRRRFELGYKQVQSTVIFKNTETIMLERLKRTVSSSPDRNKNNARSKRKRDRIEIKFKFIGKIIEENFENPKRGVQKLREKIGAMAQVGKLDLLDNRTNQEIARLALNLHLVFKEPEDLCDPGSVLKRHGCVKCLAGTFYNSSTRACQPCPFGQYQNATASLACVPCPKYTSTKRMHAKSLKNCISVCQPGYYFRRKRYHESRLGTEPCFPCDIGFYQSDYGQNECLPCSSNTTTEKRGSTHVDDCLPIRDEEIDCRMDPCLNGGQCLRDESGFVCECREYFVGSKCEEFKDPCDSSPCLNEGVCETRRYIDNFVTYECKCKSSYWGVNCQVYVDECYVNPCQNGGRCVSTENDFSCECQNGFEGQFCEIPIDYCEELKPCEEGSACRIVNGTWQCLCKPGFLGRHCNLLPCDWLPCHANAICVNVEEEDATRMSYRCECPDGYTGEDCATKIDRCESSPCLNNGRCVSRVHDHLCECPVPFTGRDCETELSSDYVMHFTKSGTTDYVAAKGPARDLLQLSVCLWLQSMDTFNYGTVFSYATTFHDNAFTLTDYNGLVLYVNGEKIVTDVKVNDGNWHFLCVTWASERGTWRVFVDGILKDSGVGLAQRTVVRANGSFVIGQEQDRLGGGFSESEAFLGRLGLLDMWDVVLNESDVTKLWNSCDKYHGNLVAWAQLQQYVHGDVVILASPFCHGCPLPVVPSKGNIKVSEDLSEVTYYCDNGYIIRFGGEEHRSLKRKCLKYGQWEGHDTPSCTKIKCGFPGHIPRGRIHGESYYFEDEIHYSCDEGYELHGNPHRICNSDGNWLGLAPICIGITCKNLLAPENGDIEYILEENERDDVTILQAGQQLEFKCNPGYRLTGERYLTCLEIGVWDHKMPSCIPYGCPPPRQIEHGYIVYSSSGMSDRTTSVRDSDGSTIDDSSERTYRFDDIVGFTCHRGYKFRGNHNLLTEFKLQCSANGTWMGFVPDCVLRTCSWPDRVADARLFLRKQDDGMVEIPEADATLGSNRGRTRRNKESDEISPETFVSGTEIIVVCDPEYELVGDRVRTCTEEERWSSTIASCKPRNCSVENHPVFKFFKRTQNETILRNTDVLESDEKLYGIENVTRAYKDLEIFVEGNSYGRRIILTCRNGAWMNKLIANETVSNITWTCNKMAKWEVSNSSLKEPMLERLLNDSTDICDRTCVLPQVPEYGYIDHGNNTDDVNDRRAIDSVIVYKCRHGYVLEGDERSVCLSDAKWSALPSCKPVVCGKPPVLANAILKSDAGGTQNYTFGNMISYQCVPGYRVFGQANLRCLGSGKWSRLNGRCSKISCGKPQIKNGIALYGHSYLFQDQLTYVCPDGKKRGMITCRADGTWSDLPRCDRSGNM